MQVVAVAVAKMQGEQGELVVRVGVLVAIPALQPLVAQVQVTLAAEVAVLGILAVLVDRV
jgi:hypothetical protein